MQVQYDSRLIDPASVRSEDFTAHANQTLDDYALSQVALASISQLLSCQVSGLIAAHVNNSCQILLIDTRGQSKRVDKFPLKSCDKKFSRHSFSPTGIAFSPDGSRLAVGQSDAIIYIYKLFPLPATGSSVASISSSGINVHQNLSALGQSVQQQQQQLDSSQRYGTSAGTQTNLAAKPTITGKFVCNSPVTCLIWTELGIIFGTQDGRIKMISITPKVPNAPNSDTQLNSSSSNGVVSTLSAQQQPNLASQSAPSPASAKVSTIYSPAKYVTPISMASRMSHVIIGFIDATVHLISLPGEFISTDQQATVLSNDITLSASLNGQRKSLSSVSTSSTVIEHSCPPYKLKLLTGNMFCCAGSDGRLGFYTHPAPSSPARKSLSIGPEWSQLIEMKEEIMALDYSSVNEILAIATTTRIMFLKYDLDSMSWQVQASWIEMQFTGTPPNHLTGLIWSKDGGHLVLGSARGSLELFKCNWSKQSVGDQLDICQIAKNRVRITDQARNLLATYKTRHDIKRVNLLDKNKSVIIWTTASLFVAKLGLPNHSEISWRKEKDAKFHFAGIDFALIYSAQETDLQVVKLGVSRPVFVIRIAPNLAMKCFLSVQCFPPNNQLTDGVQTQVEGAEQEAVERESIEVENKPKRVERFAYMEAENLLVVVDLQTKSRVFELNSRSQIVWLKLSYTGRYLAYRDSEKNLSLLDLSLKDDKGCKMTDCSFSDWLNESDILITQCKHEIRINYEPEEWLQGKRLKTSMTRLDARAFGSTGKSPLIDLSLKEHGYPCIVMLESHEMKLSNGFKMDLNETWVRFFRHLSLNQLEQAFSALENGPETNQFLWNKLGWLAIEQHNCDVALKVFGFLGATSMRKYLERCKKSPGLDGDILLFKLLGDWQAFERAAEPDEVVGTYRRLNKWSRLIEYLTGAQRFKQRDAAEEERQSWLLSEGRLLEAAEARVKCNGDLIGALDLLGLESDACTPGTVRDAAQLLLAEPARRQLNLLSPKERELLVDKARVIKTRLMNDEQFELAAAISLELMANEPGVLDEALQLYLEAGAFERAALLAQNSRPHQLVAIRMSHAEHLIALFKARKISRAKAKPAIDLYGQVGEHSKALESALELHYPELGQEQLRAGAARSCQFGDLPAKLAECWLSVNNREAAIEALSIGGLHDRRVELLIESHNFETALEVSIRELHKGDREMAFRAFRELAKSLERDDPQAAERVYLLIGEPDAAIQMHRRLGNERQVILLVERHRPEQLEGLLLALARDRELEGNLEAAERLMMQASRNEWTNVVRMYRLANRWSDAYRVASNHCAHKLDPLLIQLAYWWARSVQASGSDGKAALDLLLPLQMVGPVLEFCCDNKSFSFALALCEHIKPADNTSPDNEELLTLKQNLIKRYSSHLEQELKFEEAAEHLVRFGLVQEAVRMYLDNEKPSEAIKLIETQLNSSGQGEAGSHRSQVELKALLDSTLIEAADQTIEKQDSAQPMAERLQAAQQMYLRAQRPELAVKMYEKRSMWRDAAAVAQRFAPHLLENIEKALDAEISRETDTMLVESRSTIKSDISSPEHTVDDLLRLIEQQANGANQARDYSRTSELIKRCANKLTWGLPKFTCARNWLKLRDIVNRMCLESKPSQELEQWLWLAHFASVHAWLVGQLLQKTPEPPYLALFEGLANREADATDREKLVQLAADIALYMVRHRELLEAKWTLYVAAFWQISANRPLQAQSIWTHLLELAEDHESRAPDEQQKAEVRAWLLRHLIESPQVADTDQYRIDLDSNWAAYGPMCLLCGGGAASSPEEPALSRLGVRAGRELVVHANELELLQARLDGSRGRVTRRLAERRAPTVTPNEINDFLLGLRQSRQGAKDGL